jgi:hypothetical protein
MSSTSGMNALSSRWPFRLGAAVLILAAVVHVATLWPRVTQLAGVLPAGKWMLVAGFGISAATALAACGLAALLLWKAADRPDGRALTLFLAFLAIFWGSLFRFMSVSAESRSISIDLSYGGGWISKTALASSMLAIAMFLRFSALFPVPLDVERLPASRLPRFLRRLRAASLRPAPVYVILTVLLLLQNFSVSIVSRLTGADSLPPDASPPPILLASLFVPLVLATLAIVLAVGVGVRNLRDSYRLAAPAERRRLQWIVGGFSAAAWMVVGAIGLILLIRFAGLDSDVIGLAFPLALILAPLVAVLGACAGVLYSGAIDPALALEKSTVYGVVGAVGLVAFAGIENALSNLVEQRLQLPGFVGAMFAGAIVTLALVPVRKSISVWVRHRSPLGSTPATASQNAAGLPADMPRSDGLATTAAPPETDPPAARPPIP